MTNSELRLNLTDAAELSELLTFLSDWLDSSDHAQLAASLHRFVGVTTYDLNTLRHDLTRFTFLLGADNGDQLFGLNQ
jgi:hypothetical protein